MSQHNIAAEDAENDIFTCAAFLAEAVPGSDGHAEAMKSIVPRYVAQGNVDLAAELANSVDDPFTRDRLLILVAEKCADIGDNEYARQLVDAIDDHGLHTLGLEKVAIRNTLSGNVEKASEIAAEMPHPDNVLAAVAVHEYRNRNFELAKETLNRIEFPVAKVDAILLMASGTEREHGQDVDTLIDSATATASQIEHAEEKIRTYCEIGNHYVDRGLAVKAADVLVLARAEAEGLDNVHRDNLLANISLGFLHAGDVAEADKTLDLVGDKTQIASCLLGFAREYWRKAERDEALEALEESYAVLRSQRDKETRDSKARFNLLSAIASQFAGFEKSDRGIELARDIPEETAQISALSQIAQIETVRQNHETANDALSEIVEDSDQVFALIGMSDASYRNGDAETATLSLNKALSIAETVPQLSSRTAALNEIARRLAILGDPAGARETALLNMRLIPTIRDESIRAVAVADLSDVYLELSIEPADEEKVVLRQLVRSAQL
ncbi:MAG: hypothetical protein WBD22_02155 [Pyrinomonadaceae bacterium]